jgi:hypothetical protein
VVDDIDVNASGRGAQAQFARRKGRPRDGGAQGLLDEARLLLSHYNDCLRLSGALDLGLDEIEGLRRILLQYSQTGAQHRRRPRHVCFRRQIVP